MTENRRREAQEVDEFFLSNFNLHSKLIKTRCKFHSRTLIIKKFNGLDINPDCTWGGEVYWAMPRKTYRKKPVY